MARLAYGGQHPGELRHLVPQPSNLIVSRVPRNIAHAPQPSHGGGGRTAQSDSVSSWTLRMAAGSLQQWQFAFTINDPSVIEPYPIDGATWEYVVRDTATDTGSPVFSITTAASAAGLITVTSSATVSQVALDIYPAATAALDGTYYHTLWMDPSTSSQFTWVTGNLLVQGNPQP